MLLPNRHGSTDSYRYGFNGKEKDDEVKGEGAQYDYGFRIYDPRIGKFLSEDPLTASYPWYTPYQFAGNKPISSIDIDGLEDVYYAITFDEQGSSKIDLVKEKDGVLCNCFGKNLYFIAGGKAYYKSSYSTSGLGKKILYDWMEVPTFEEALANVTGKTRDELQMYFKDMLTMQESRAKIHQENAEFFDKLFKDAVTFGRGKALSDKGHYTKNNSPTTKVKAQQKTISKEIKTPVNSSAKTIVSKDVTTTSGNLIAKVKIEGKGDIRIEGKIVPDGKTVIIKNLSVVGSTPKGGNYPVNEFGASTMLKTFKEISKEFKKSGYDKVIFEGGRAPWSSSANKGKEVKLEFNTNE